MSETETEQPKNKGGRPTLYCEDMLNKTIAYVEGYHSVVPTIERLALCLDVNKTTIYEWEAEHVKFSNALSRLRNLQAAEVIEKGLSGDFNPTIAKLMLGNHGYSDKSSTEHSGSIIQVISGVPAKIGAKKDE